VVNYAPASERDGLSDFLDKQRDILIRKIEGLTDEQARSAPTASSLSLLGILKHCATWERRWFQVIFAGHTSPGEWPQADRDNRRTFDVGPRDTVQQWLAYYREQLAESRRIVAGSELDAGCAYWPAYWSGEAGDLNLRWVLLHHIEEVARHAGHADIIRETIDGSTGE
jgi:uncharacterized damage-inducible protein DinB